MAKHTLKTEQKYFNDIWNLTKKFEIRENDRLFKVGDIVFLKEYIAEKNIYTDRVLKVKIIYILDKFKALDYRYIIFSFQILEFSHFDPFDNNF